MPSSCNVQCCSVVGLGDDLSSPLWRDAPEPEAVADDSEGRNGFGVDGDEDVGVLHVAEDEENARKRLRVEAEKTDENLDDCEEFPYDC